MSFLKPKAPTIVQNTPEPAPAAPTIDTATAQADNLDKLRKRRGFASTILVPDSTQALGSAPGTSAVLG